jgi:hypothetical protein
VESSDGCEVSSWPDGDLFLAVQHAVVVFDHSRDDLACVTWAEPDPLSGDHDLAVCVHPGLRPPRPVSRPALPFSSFETRYCVENLERVAVGGE